MTAAEPRRAVELPPEAQEVIRKLEAAKDEQRAVEERIAKLRQEVLNLLGDADEGTVNGRPVARFTRVESRHVDSAALKTTYPEVYDQVTKIRSTGQLRTALGADPGALP